MARILVVEDNESLRGSLYDLLRRMKHDVLMASTAEEALEIIYLNTFDLLITDLVLPKQSGIDLISEVRNSCSQIPIVVMTAHASLDTAVDVLRLGAQDFLTKPFSPECLAKVIERQLSQRDSLTVNDEQCVITKNPKMKEILNIAKKLGPLPTSVLIHGESGSGKEVLAKYIHYTGSRKKAPFIGINCASIPKNLMESEFFGYEPGAFTGATNSKEGLFEAAHNGTLFLDEVAEMPMSLQVKLLRAIQEGETRRLGGTKSKSVNVRVISATNKNLEKQIESMQFREDLFYRLGVFVIEIPPLRERREDISPLADFFAARYKDTLGLKEVSISKEAKQVLFSYSWPGNVRELENIIERALIFSNGNIEAEHVQVLDSQDQIGVGELHLAQIAEAAQRNAETAAILQALLMHQGNKTKAAKTLGVSYKTLLTKIKDYNLNIE